MTALNACMDFYSNDFSNLNLDSYCTLSSIFSNIESCDESQPIVEENEEKSVWKKLVEDNEFLPKSQPKISQLKQQICEKLSFDFIQLFVDFYNVYSNSENNHHISEKSFDTLQDILWKCNACTNKHEQLNADKWAEVKSNNVSNSMPKKPQNVAYLISKINLILSENTPRITQLKLDNEQARLETLHLSEQRTQFKTWRKENPEQKISFNEWQSLDTQEQEPEQEPEWDNEPATTQLNTSSPEEPVVESEPEPVAESEPEPVAESEPEPVVESEPEPVVESEPEPVVEAEEPVAEAEEPVVESEEPVAESEPEPVAESEELIVEEE